MGSIRASVRDLQGYYNIGAFVIRIGFWAQYTMLIIRNAPKKRFW